MLFLGSDSLTAFKSTLLHGIGLYLTVTLKLIYAAPRPYWNTDQKHPIQFVPLLDSDCYFDFASPVEHVFSLTFFWTYTIYMYHVKYVQEVNYKMVYLMYFTLAIITGITCFGLILFAVVYLYQILVTVLFSIAFGIIVVSFDAQILAKCEQIGFIVRTSRQNKFYILFISIG